MFLENKHGMSFKSLMESPQFLKVWSEQKRKIKILIFNELIFTWQFQSFQTIKLAKSDFKMLIYLIDDSI